MYLCVVTLPLWTVFCHKQQPGRRDGAHARLAIVTKSTHTQRNLTTAIQGAACSLAH